MQINVTFDQPTGSLPTGFVAAVNYVVGLYDSLFTNAVTVNIDVGYGEIAGQTLAANALGESEAYLVSPTYAQTVTALRGAATSTLQKSADATLPATAPYGSGNLWLTTADAKAIGLLAPNGSSLDGYVGFSATLPFGYSTTAAPGAGQYDFVAVVEHEVSEVLGRISLLGETINGATSYGLMDMFRYSAPGVRDLTATPPNPYGTAYFSVNGGATNLDSWNTVAGGDLGDWAASAGADSFLAFSPSGQLDGLGSADYALMNALGWTLTPPATNVTSATVAPSSGALSLGQTVSITLTLSAAVSVAGSGAPTLLLNDGGVAIYNAAATAALKQPTALVFSYTVGAGDHNVPTLAVVGSNLNGASVTDEFGNVPNLSGADVGFAGLSVALPPTVVSSVVATPGTGVAGVGQTITLTAAFNRAVVLSGGTPTLLLDDGGTALYNAAATAALGDPTRLVFTYTVAATDTSVTTLAIVGGYLNGANIVDSNGQVPNFSGLYTSFPAIQVATAPTALTAVVATAVNSDAHVGDTVTLTLVFNRGVTVSGNGTPSLALNDGGTALYNAAATAALGDPTRLVFSYTVAATDAAVSALAIIGGSENGAYIADAAGQGPNFSGLLTSFPTIQIGTLPTVVTSVVASPGSGVMHFGDIVTLTLGMSQAVTVSGGTPTLTLNDGGIAVYDATATAALGDPTRLVFNYTVAGADQSVSALALTGGSLNGASIVDAHGNVPSFAAIYAASFPSLSTLVGIDLTTVAYGAQTSLAYAPNSTDTGGTLTVTDTVHSAQIALLGQYAAADFHLGSDFHGGTVVSDPSLTGAAQTAFLASAHT